MEEKSAEDLKPGAGVDRTVIRQLLAVSEKERVRLLVVEARNVSALVARMRGR